MWNFRFFGLLLLTEKGRILKRGIFEWPGDWKGYFLLVWGQGLELVWLEGRRYSPTFSVRKKR